MGKRRFCENKYKKWNLYFWCFCKFKGNLILSFRRNRYCLLILKAQKRFLLNDKNNLPPLFTRY